eukprot:6181483-Pleurochrysis_carterae.AAC.1
MHASLAPPFLLLACSGKAQTLAHGDRRRPDGLSSTGTKRSFVSCAAVAQKAAVAVAAWLRQAGRTAQKETVKLAGQGSERTWSGWPGRANGAFSA